MPVDIHKRDFFGMGEIIGVLTNVCPVLVISYPQVLTRDPSIASGDGPISHRIQATTRRCKA